MKTISEVKIQKIGNENELTESIFKIDFKKYDTDEKFNAIFTKVYKCRKIFENHQIAIYVGGENGRNVFKIDRIELKYRYI